MSVWQATELHLIATGVWGGQIHWSVSSVVDMYNTFLLVAFAGSRAWRAHKSPRPVKCQTSSSDSSAALSNPYVNIHREWKCNDYIRLCWGWGKLLLITEISQIAIELIIQHVYLISYFNPVPGRHQFTHEEEKSKAYIRQWCCKKAGCYQYPFIR